MRLSVFAVALIACASSVELVSCGLEVEVEKAISKLAPTKKSEPEVKSKSSDKRDEAEGKSKQSDASIKPQTNILQLVAGNAKAQVPFGFADERPKGIWELADCLFATLFGAPAPDAKGTKSEFAYYAINDHSNDDLVYATPQELIEQAGFKHRTHFVEADDGYITQMIRIINPLADRKRLRQPPVAMFHGGTLDTGQYIIQSTRQHHPERWPRVQGQIHTSWNRSLGFMLANNGYDVWLVGSRGCNRANQGHKFVKGYKPLYTYDLNASPDWVTKQLELSFTYWSNHTFDDIIDKEIPRQLERIMLLTGSPKVSVVALSNSSPSTMAVLASKPKLAKKVHNYVAIAPLLSAKNSNRALRVFFETIGTKLPDQFGNLVMELILSRPIRDAILALNQSPLLRYSLIKIITNIAFGSSPRFQTLIEPNALNHILNPFGFRSIKHISQVLLAGKIQKFDFGPIENQLRYGSIFPPAYDMSKMTCANWMIVTAEHDQLSTYEDVQKLATTTPKRPYRHLYWKNANHVDLVMGADIDTRVNLPILEFMQACPYKQTKKVARNVTLVDGKIDITLKKYAPEYDRSLNYRAF